MLKKMKIKIIPKNYLCLKLYKTIQYSFIIIKIFNKNFFFKLRKNIHFIKIQKNFFFVLEKKVVNTLLSLKALYLKIGSLVKNQKYFFCKKVFLQGLGFKIISVVQNNFIELKIGYSHYVKIFIPTKDGLYLYINKNMIIVKGSDKVKVGNFANKIKSFRIPDNYKGKGI